MDGRLRLSQVITLWLISSLFLAAAQGQELSVAASGQGLAFSQATPVAVSVTINAPRRPAVLFNPASRSPEIVLNTTVYPPGGTFNWQIVSGQDKIRLSGVTRRNSVSLRLVAASTTPDDAVVRVTYTAAPSQAESLLPVTLTAQGAVFAQATGVAVATADLALTVQRPTSTAIVSGPVSDKKKGEAYAFVYGLQVCDQFGHGIEGDILPVHKLVTRKSSNHPIWWGLVVAQSGDSRTDSDGVFTDRLSLRSIPFVPGDLTARVQQDLTVAGWPVGGYYDMYYSDHTTKDPMP
jgi:hypothetical protein